MVEASSATGRLEERYKLGITRQRTTTTRSFRARARNIVFEHEGMYCHTCAVELAPGSSSGLINPERIADTSRRAWRRAWATWMQCPHRHEGLT